VKVPFVNLARQYKNLQTEIDDAIKLTLAEGTFIGGNSVAEFEKRFASLHDDTYCIGTGNGTDSLFLILKALNIQPNNEVIVPAFGCMPTAEVITLAGGNVVFADVHPEYYTLDPKSVEQKMTRNTKAIIAVHLYGQAAQLNELRAICNQHNLHLIEDCAQSHLTTYRNQYVGTFGVASAFSFYPTKNLGAFGDAGCALTRDADLAEKIRRLANHGALKKNDHLLEGTNSRLDTIQAAILNIKLKELKNWNDRRAYLATKYKEGLKDISQLIIPSSTPGSSSSYHIFCIRTSKRDALQKFLADKGIETLIHYPLGLPFTQAYSFKKHVESDFPVTAQLQQEVLSLPIYPELTDLELQFVIDSIRAFFP
jgi:dTDP-4-amino-4,6-dideoxygalactose transaminase